MAEDKNEHLSAEFLGLQPSSSSHSKPCKRSPMRPITCFVLENCVFKKKHFRSLIKGLVQGFE